MNAEIIPWGNGPEFYSNNARVISAEVIKDEKKNSAFILCTDANNINLYIRINGDPECFCQRLGISAEVTCTKTLTRSLAVFEESEDLYLKINSTLGL